MLSSTLPRNETKLNRQRSVWLALNKGVLTRIADEFGLNRAFVSDIYRNKRTSKGGRVEQRLAELGAPGFTKAA